MIDRSHRLSWSASAHSLMQSLRDDVALVSLNHPQLVLPKGYDTRVSWLIAHQELRYSTLLSSSSRPVALLKGKIAACSSVMTVKIALDVISLFLAESQKKQVPDDILRAILELHAELDMALADQVKSTGVQPVSISLTRALSKLQAAVRTEYCDDAPRRRKFKGSSVIKPLLMASLKYSNDAMTPGLDMDLMSDSDGKVMLYIIQLTDALLNEVNIIETLPLLSAALSMYTIGSGSDETAEESFQAINAMINVVYRAWGCALHKLEILIRETA